MSDSVSIQEQSLSRYEIEAFVADWYRKLDEHAPAGDLIPMLAEQGLEFQLPEGPLTSGEAFRQWYEGGGRFPGVLNLFFDETHTVREVRMSWEDRRTLVSVTVNWQARRWQPPRPRSQWIGFDAYQSWEMIRSPSTARPVIRRYIVDELRAMPGSPPL